MYRAYSVEQIREAEAVLLSHLPEGTLMRRAAYGLANAIAHELITLTGGIYGRRICAIIGAGDNGGDALWAATFLQRRGVSAYALLLSPSRANTHALRAFRHARGKVITNLPNQIDIVIDGVVGLSGQGPLRPGAAELFDQIHTRNIPIVAVDLPSGIDPMTGIASGPAVQAHLTVTFGGLKPVHLLANCGKVQLIDIGLDLNHPILKSFESHDLHSWWPIPHREDNKYTQGVTGILAGSALYPGAAILCTGAALASRSGMIRYAGTAAKDVVNHWPEVVATSHYSDAGQVQAWVVGPGLGTDPLAQKTLEFALATDLPVLVDADALTLLAKNPSLVTTRHAPTILTPHEGEFTRLFGQPLSADRVSDTQELARRFGAIVLLKGYITIIANPDGSTYINNAGQTWASTAGSGDVLAGIIGSLLATGVDPLHAAAAGAFIHTRAATIAADHPGPGSAPISASHIVSHIRSAIALL